MTIEWSQGVVRFDRGAAARNRRSSWATAARLASAARATVAVSVTLLRCITRSKLGTRSPLAACRSPLNDA